MQEMRLRMPGRALARAQPQMVNPLKKKDAVRPRIELKERGRDFLDDISAYGRSEKGDRGDKMRTSGERERPQDRGDRRRPLGRGIAPRMGIGMEIVEEAVEMTRRTEGRGEGLLPLIVVAKQSG